MKPAIKKNEIDYNTVLKMIPNSDGNISDIAEKLKVKRHALVDFIGRCPGIQRALADENERLKDELRQALIDAAKAGSTVHLTKFLEAEAKDFGYGRVGDDKNKKNDQPLVKIVFPAGFTDNANPEEWARQYHSALETEKNKNVSAILGTGKK